ncbi:GntR family transcriptional regulator [Mucilaginibacter agri]|uniref:GntR family transcriptional regulator n=1 Tax=Mucilaginibacter agri TaxID=2695265 RepID=A0A965ZM91_9SPHI|nr:GntR family transcriptional regulator [Mucilaginibacter agri]NCD72524.1 GntR family transcriptional regulator [Mucilaginibacter agri]
MKTDVDEIIQIDASLAIPIYKQIVQSIYRSIDSGTLTKDDLLPSVNKVSEKFSLARGSVFSAYNDLRAAGIIDSIPGKGYFVSSTETKQNKRIFLLFSTFTPYKETLYNALINSLPKTCSVDIYFHHHSAKMFDSLISGQAGYYNTFIIMPEVGAAANQTLALLDPRQTFLLDVGFKEYHDSYAGVYQNFEDDIFSILMQSKEMVAKYERLFLVFPEGLRTKDIIAGFNKFSKSAGVDTTTEVLNTINIDNIKKGDAFIVIDDNHLVDVIKIAKENKWKLGKDIGVLSYNETALKSVIGDGISTVTTDFAAMGRSMAKMILSGKKEVLENPFVLIDRNSF